MRVIKEYFEFSKENTTYSKEIVAGITTFLSMAYILVVNPNMLVLAGMKWEAVFTATCLASIIGSLIMGIYAKLPVALAPGMGLNALFTFTICLGHGLSFQEALFLVFISGVIFFLISISKLKKIIISSIPNDLKHAIGAGIGFFIAFIGVQSSGIIVNNDTTLVMLGDLKSPEVLLTIFGLFITIILYVREIKGAILLGILLTSLVGMYFGLIDVPKAILSLPQAPNFMDFLDGFNTLNFKDNLVLYISLVFVLLFTTFFDNVGTLIAVCSGAKLMQEDNKDIKNSQKAIVSASISDMAGAVVGTSTTTSYIESLSGVTSGGKTGFVPVITALCFAMALFLSPLLVVITAACTAPALIIVGILMAKNLGQINWNSIEIAIPSFLVILLMPLGYSIALGIAIGFIFYPVGMVVAKKAREINVLMLALMVFSLLYFIFGKEF